MSEAGREPSRVEVRPFNMVEEIASAYLTQADGDPSVALLNAIGDAVADFLELERRTRCAERLVSRGYVRVRAARQSCPKASELVE